MIKTLTNDELDQLLNFVGYGRLDADLWFIGYQEHMPPNTDIQPRLELEQVEDSAEALEKLGVTLQSFAENNLHNAWHGMAEIMLRLAKKSPTETNIRAYLTRLLGRSNGAVLIANLLPIPVNMDGSWNFGSEIPQYAAPSDYYEEVKPLRMNFFREILHQQLPKVIIAHGKEAWADYQELFKDFKLDEHGEFLVGWDANTVVVLTEELSSEAMIGKYEDLVTLILENSLEIDVEKHTGPTPLSKAELARQQKEAAKKVAAAKRKPATKHNASDPYCVCAQCLSYEKK